MPPYIISAAGYMTAQRQLVVWQQLTVQRPEVYCPLEHLKRTTQLATHFVTFRQLVFSVRQRLHAQDNGVDVAGRKEAKNAILATWLW